MGRLLANGSISESDIQRTVMGWVKAQPHLAPYVIHIPNEGRRTPRYGKALKDMGMRKGVSDLFIAMGCKGYYGAWIELKSKKGKLSEDQKEFLAQMQEKNYFTAVCYTIDETIDIIRGYIN